MTRGFAPAGCQSLSDLVELQLHQFLFYFGLEAEGKLTNVTSLLGPRELMHGRVCFPAQTSERVWFGPFLQVRKLETR